MYVAEDNSDI